MRKPSVYLVAAFAAVLLLASVPATADPLNSPFQYSIKFVCGFVPFQPPGEEGPVKPGNYATAINIHNPTRTRTIPASMRVTLHYRDGTPLSPVIPVFTSKVFRYRTLEVDCPVIWGRVGLPPGTFTKGMLHLGLPEALPVAAVYTSQTYLGPGAALDAGAGISIDVENVKPFREPPVMPAAP